MMAAAGQASKAQQGVRMGALQQGGGSGLQLNRRAPTQPAKPPLAPQPQPVNQRVQLGKPTFQVPPLPNPPRGVS
jgi:hypothetical protein